MGLCTWPCKASEGDFVGGGLFLCCCENCRGRMFSNQGRAMFSSVILVQKNKLGDSKENEK